MQAITFLLALALPFLLSLKVWPSQAADRSVTNVNVGLILDSRTLEEKVISSCIEMAIEDFYSNCTSGHTKRLVLQRRHYQNDTTEAVSAVIDLLKKVEVEAILGPVTSGDSELVASLGQKSHVPIISFTATSPSLPLAKDSYFVRTAQSDEHQVGAIVAIVKAYHWGEVVLIYEDSEFGKGMIPFLTDALQREEVNVPFRTVLPINSKDEHIRVELEKLTSMQTRIFLVHMNPDLGSRLFTNVKSLGMMSEGYAWIVTNGMGNLLDSMTDSATASMEGVLAVKTYVPKSDNLKNFAVRWRRRFRALNPDVENRSPYPNVLGLWAYDTIWALASALEKTNAGNSKYQHHGKNPSNSTGAIGILGVSPTGPNIFHEIRRTKFTGLSGDFVLKNGQLTSNTFEIVNLVGRGERLAGYWNPTIGLVRTLSKQVLGRGLRNHNNATDGGLKRTVIWPGDTLVVPKGWVIPTNATRLRIGVPMTKGFKELVKVVMNQENSQIRVEGYCADVFNKVLEIMPYYLPHDFIPFGESADNSTYNDLVQQVFHKKFDAVVGDITVTAERAKYVDFTLPYTETGVSMIVRIKAESRMSALIFLRPLTASLWLTTAAFFVLTGFVVWVLEHRVNPEFRGPPSGQSGAALYFAFSTMVCAHRERLSSNLSRVVVIVWVFVVLIVTQSYTASLTSFLTVQQLHPTATDIQTLIRDGENIGYPKKSFVHELLVKQLKVHESKLRGYTTIDEFAEALIKGSQNGGVAAVFDEIPYIRLFLARYCAGFAMAGPTYKAGGFAFVFQRGSPFVNDVSRAILKITEEDGMAASEERLYQNQTCADMGIEADSSSLSLTHLRGLFYLTGTTSFGALILFFLNFFYNYRRAVSVTGSTSEQISWHGITSILWSFDQKHTSSHAFRNMAVSDNKLVTPLNVEAEERSIPETPVSNADSVGGAPQVSNHGDSKADGLKP